MSASLHFASVYSMRRQLRSNGFVEGAARPIPDLAARYVLIDLPGSLNRDPQHAREVLTRLRKIRPQPQGDASFPAERMLPIMVAGTRFLK
jgi:hypothetical protein